ncbi:MAG: H(+)-transporting two-sector ATPase [Nitrospirae bacterium]|nr:H(+)-transporting two-sector ATPase [Nitrospirota bacterium]
MSKIEIVGPKQLLQDVLTLIRSLGLFHIEPSTVGFIEKGQEEELRSYALDEKTIFERLFLEDLREKIHKLFSYLPKLPVRKSYLDPQPIIGTIAYTIEKHIASCRELEEQREGLHREMADLRRYSGFLDTLESLFRDAMASPNLDVIGLTIKDPSAVEHVRALLSRLTGDKFKLFTIPAGDGTLGGLITVEKTVSEKVSKALSSEHIPEMSLPESFELLSLTGKIEYLEKRTSEVLAGIEVIDRSIEKICRRWRPIYASVLEWIGERLSLLSASAYAFQTNMCFFINGWIPAADIGGLKQQLTDSFGSQVVVEEKEMREEDLERVPVMLKNPAYFKPFELFTRVLPLPTYTSLDPTPFLGIFFPIFFGMILGDAGYGLFLLILSIVLKKRFLKKKMLRDATQILFISSLYTIFFGVLYSEFFGDLPLRFFGIEPVCVERRTAVIPMLYFTLAVGVAHVLLGLFLGIITALKKKTNKEAFLKLLSILIIVCLIIVLASFFDVFPEIVAQPVIMMILFLMPFLLFTGGLLAPLELLKSIGNIISYVRIMAIGLTSVLLAFTANNIAGRTGNIVVGIVAAVLLHLLNIVLGVFSPTIHSLRLHYVEFFSKFYEHGGKEFEPMKQDENKGS